jgi:hypothetical protein
MKRRDFLRLSCTAAVAAFGRTLRAATLWRKRSLDPQLSIAFSENGIALSDVRRLSGDGRFLSQDAAVRVVAFRGPYEAGLDAIYRIGGQPVRFHAASTNSAPTRFRMPVDAIDGLQFEVRPRDGQAPIPLRFGVNSKAGSTPLRRGRYVVALHERESPPDWRAVDLTSVAAVDFNVLLLEFDYGMHSQAK